MSRFIIAAVEDDSGAQFVYRDILGATFDLQFFETLSEYRSWRKAGNTPNLCLADLVLGDGQFLDFLRSPEFDPRTERVIVVSGVVDVSVLRECLQLGALDYLVKPFHRSQLLAKVEHILNVQPSNGYQTIGVTIRRGSAVYQGQVSPELTKREAQILQILVDSSGGGTPKATLLREVWGNLNVTDKVVEVHISNLRAKLTKVGLAIICVKREYRLGLAKDLPTKSRAV